MSLPTLTDFRERFAEAGLVPVDLNGNGPGFMAMCPKCASAQLRVVAGEDGRITMECPNGCDSSRIADEIEFRTARPGGFAEPDDLLDDPLHAASWQPVDLAAILEGEQSDEAPTMLARADGVCLLYAGRIHAISAEPESCKGWAALHASAERLIAGANVVYVDYEDTAANIVARLVALDVDRDAIRERFHYVRPDDPVTPEAVAAVAELDAALVVIDGVTEALAMEALDMANNQDVAEFDKRLARPFARAGAAVLMIDHVVKDRESRGRYAIGAQHKLAGVDVAYRLDVAQPFGRGREGLVKVTVTKDRPGHVRQHAVDRERVAMLRLTSDEGRVAVALEAPEGGVFRPTVLMERVSRAIEDDPGLSTRDIRQLRGKTDTLETARKQLISEDYIRVERDGPAARHYSIRAFRHTDGDPVPHGDPNVPPGTGDPVPPSLNRGGTVPGRSGTADGDPEPLALATLEEEERIARLGNAA